MPASPQANHHHLNEVTTCKRAQARANPSLCPRMYGPPQDCKGKAAGREDKSAQMYSAFGWRLVLLAMMSCARVCPSKSVGCSFETILGTRLRTRCCDYSFVLAVPMQTSVGNTSSRRRLIRFRLMPWSPFLICNLRRSTTQPKRCVRACWPWRLRRRSWELSRPGHRARLR
jgi:hypothetical protein